MNALHLFVVILHGAEGPIKEASLEQASRFPTRTVESLRRSPAEAGTDARWIPAFARMTGLSKGWGRGFEMTLPFMWPIEPFILDPEVSEIMVNGPEHVFIERRGFLEPVPVTLNPKSFLVAVKNVARCLGSDIRGATAKENPCKLLK
jgi:hypothetical protein